MKRVAMAIVRLCVLGWCVGAALGAPVQRPAVPISPQPQPAPVSPQPVQVSPQPQPAPAPAPVIAAPQPVAVPLRVPINVLPRRTLAADPQPSIGPNAEILLFIHGMDSRAEEADDITKALFAAVGA